MDTAIDDLVTPQFRLHHRERFAVGLPPDDREGLLAERRAVNEVGGQLKLLASDVVAVRGDRLALIRTVMADDRGYELRVATIFGLDARLRQLELMVRFDGSSAGDALVELDRLHAEMVAQDP